LLFLLLQVISIALLVSYNKSHQAKYMEWAYDATGSINKRYSNIAAYFSLADNNKRLAEENNRLRNLLAENFTSIDTSATLRLDTAMVDSSRVIRKYLWRTAAVINNSVASQNNFITIERGRLQGIAPEMAVVSAGGIVGVVTDVSDNMAIVRSLLHRKSITSVMLKNGRNTGLLEWDGQKPWPVATERHTKKYGPESGRYCTHQQYFAQLPCRPYGRHDSQSGKGNRWQQLQTAGKTRQ
jgi:Cell shape-determining protein